MKKVFKYFVIITLGCYALFLISIYFFQENLIFHPTKLPQEYTFNFEENFEEKDFITTDRETINSLYFYSKTNKKGVIYFLHGNSGDLSGWGDVAPYFTKNGYDVFMIDYRGFGKSTGKIVSEKQFLDDAQFGYDYLKKSHLENDITIIGYSIGTGPAAYLAANNNPKNLVIASPYYSFESLAQEKIPYILPSFVLKYPLKTNDFLNETKTPITIFHGEDDRLIPIHHAKKLFEGLKDKKVNFYPIEGLGHNGILKNYVFLNKMDSILKLTDLNINN